jgi:hypothetical protein
MIKTYWFIQFVCGLNAICWRYRNAIASSTPTPVSPWACHAYSLVACITACRLARKVGNDDHALRSCVSVELFGRSAQGTGCSRERVQYNRRHSVGNLWRSTYWRGKSNASLHENKVLCLVKLDESSRWIPFRPVHLWMKIFAGTRQIRVKVGSIRPDFWR